MPWYNDCKATVQTDVPLAPKTWYQLGGPARWYCEPSSIEELAELIACCHQEGIGWRVLGHGANILVSDAGVDGLVIQLTHDSYCETLWDGGLLNVGGGVDFPKLCKQAVSRGLAGLDRLAGIPGTVGGITRMNAGGRYGSVAEFVQSVDYLSPQGQQQTKTAEECDFSYRRSNLGDGIVLSVAMRFEPGDKESLTKEHQRIWKEKSVEQPPMALRSAGCIFKNPHGDAAGRLIDACGLKGHRIRGAEISNRHANFILAHPDARASDVIELATYAKDRVQSEFGIPLEFEVEIW